MTAPDPEANETLSEEFRRLISEYHDAADGDPTKEEEAWNLIADFSVANCEAIFDGLSALYAEAQAASAERIAELERQLPEGMEHCTIVFKECELGHAWLTATSWVQHGCPTCAIAESERRREAAEKMLREADAVIAEDHVDPLTRQVPRPYSIVSYDRYSEIVQAALSRHAARANV